MSQPVHALPGPGAKRVQARFIALLGVVTAGFLGTYFWIQRGERAEGERLLAEARRQQAQTLEHWLNRTELSLRDFAAGAAGTEGVAQPQDSEAGRAKLQAVLAGAEAQAAWLVRPDGTPVFAAGRAGEKADPPLPIAPGELGGLLDGAHPPHFFAEQGGSLFELCGSPVAGATGQAPPRAWLLVARFWGPAHLATLASLLEAEVRLEPPGSVTTGGGPGTVTITRALADGQGRALRQLLVRRDPPELAFLLRPDSWQARVFVVFGLLLLLAFGLALQAWVLRPLAAIQEGLATGNTQPLAALQGEQTELARIATLVTHSFEQREALQQEVETRTRTETELRQNREELRRTLEERAALARDLHDGVIQSLYAAGMGLAGIRAQLQPGQEATGARLEETRVALNQTIRDVRNFITGLEPEALKEQSFAQAVTALLGFMQSVRAFEAVIAIDDAVAGRLTLRQRIHALQIAREAASNALRHGEAPEIRVSLRTGERGITFEVRDNGRGFVPGAAPRSPGSGHGLANFTRRAREIGADLVVQSEVGQGTTVTLVFLSPS